MLRLTEFMLPPPHPSVKETPPRVTLERIRVLEFHSSWNGSSMAAIRAPQHSALIAKLVDPAAGPARVASDLLNLHLQLLK